MVQKWFSLGLWFGLCFFGVTLPQLQAQSVREDLAADPSKAGNVYVSYPNPTEIYTPAPAGYEPFYISHYGRHGSRWRIDPKDYSLPVEILSAARDSGYLTPQGERVLAVVERVAREAEGRYGELSRLGARQHRAIAQRMVAHFPQVFADSAEVDARSTVVIRCILSMDAACQTYKALNPLLQITNDASAHDMYYMNAPDTPDRFYAGQYARVKPVIDSFEKVHLHPQRLMESLFTKPSYAQDNALAFMKKLYGVVVGMSCLVEEPWYTPQYNLEGLFTVDEMYDQWACNTLYWFALFGAYDATQGVMPYRQKELLRDILDKAHDFVASGKHGATLRYGHDSVISPLIALLNLDGLGRQATHLEEALDQWRIYRLVPMAANIQFVFYKKRAGALQQADPVLVKVLLNEREVTLPLSSTMAPYYTWDQVETYYRSLLR